MHLYCRKTRCLNTIYHCYMDFEQRFRTLPSLLLGCQYGNPSRKVGGICLLFFFFFFSVSVKVLPVTPLLSGIFVHRAFCSYFLRIER